jgi:hypothetical protein
MSPDETAFAPEDGTAPAPLVLLPAVIGRYRIFGLLGEGGMGAVYEAEQDKPRRIVALKVMKCAWASRDLILRFEQESQLLARLQHPGIAQVYEAGAVTGSGLQPYFAMELITRGQPLTLQDCKAVNGVPTHGGTINGPGPTIVNGMVYMTSGYAALGGGTPGNALLAFGVE